MNFIKKCFLAFGLICVGFSGFSQESSSYNIYKDAPEDVVERIKVADELLEQKKYLSAAESLGKEDNEYIIYKKTQIYTEFSIKNENNKRFYLRDLEENENLEELRKNANPTSFKSYDVEQAVLKFQRKNKNQQMPILNLALGNIYSNYLMKFDSTTKDSSNKTLIKASENYKIAEEANLYDIYSLDYLAYIESVKPDFAKMIEYFERLVILRPDYYDAYFNMMIGSRQLKQNEKSIEYAKKAISVSKNPLDIADINYYMADIYASQNDVESAKKILEDSKKTVGNSVDGAFLLGQIYWLEDQDYKKVEPEFLDSIKADQRALVSTVRFFLNKKDRSHKSHALELCSKAKELFPEDNEYLGQVSLLYAESSFVNIISIDSILEVLKEARNYFKKAGVLEKYEKTILQYENVCNRLKSFL